MHENDPFEVADASQREVDKLQERSEQLKAEAQQTREDWHHKRADESVAGAPAYPDEDEEEEEEGHSGHGEEEEDGQSGQNDEERDGQSEQDEDGSSSA